MFAKCVQGEVHSAKYPSVVACCGACLQRTQPINHVITASLSAVILWLQVCAPIDTTQLGLDVKKDAASWQELYDGIRATGE